MQATEQYQALPRKVSQHVLMLLDRSWKSFFAAIKAYTTNRRNRQITHYLHTHSRRSINMLVREGIGVLIIGKNDRYVGKRVTRGMFRTADGRRINAAVNGGYNSIRKAIPNAFGNGIGGVVVHLVGIAPTN